MHFKLFISKTDVVKKKKKVKDTEFRRMYCYVSQTETESAKEIIITTQ